ncbi:MAG: hypothetical protein WC354_07455, partial [Candidatus Omnitrophota bacterium]|jgi:hypothetical protein
LALWADILYACDGEWWERYIGDVLLKFTGELWTQDVTAASKYGLNKIDGDKAEGLGREKINYGANGGYQAVNLAYLFGAKKIILLGFDMQRGKKNKTHWHGDHPGRLNKEMPIRTWIKNFSKLADDLKNEQVEVINSTRETALECFKKIRLEEALC